MKAELYFGLERIAARLGVSKDTARDWIKKGLITAVRSGPEPRAPWLSNEQLLSNDINNLPDKLANKI